MLRIGLTGGIGAGKSTVAAMLARRGAVVVDADEIAREVVAPGGPAYEAVVARFGAGILGPDGAIDRPALARVAFSDAAALADLNAITHPVIGAVLLERLVSLDSVAPGRLGSAGGGDGDGGTGVVAAVIPLLGPAHVDSLRLRAVVVVDCPIGVAVRRLVEGRGMTEEDAMARVAAQPSREERNALADYVVDNSSSSEDLAAQVDALWAWLHTLSAQP
ncbi:MAG: dephospho-CoA kinase [Actinomycetota bacterium]|nr:dephospho-CoA kinase [Actinomycetota bacterium]